MKLSKKFKVIVYVITLNQRGPVTLFTAGEKTLCNTEMKHYYCLTHSWNWFSDYFNIDISEKHLTSGLENETVGHRAFD